MIAKLEIDLLDDTEEDYKKARAEYIVNGTKLGWSKDRAEAEWDKAYPNEYESYRIRSDGAKLSSYGQQNVINKINEIIDVLNTHGITETSADLKEMLETQLG